MSLPLRIVLFIIPMLLVLGSLHVYLYRRLIRDVGAGPRVRRFARGFLPALLVAAVGVRALSSRLPGTASRIVAVAVMGWVGFALYATLLLMAVDAARKISTSWKRRRAESQPAAPVDEAKRLFLSRAIAGTAVFASGGISAFGVRSAFTPAEPTELVLKLPRLPKALDGLTLVQLSDIHVGGVLQRKFVEDLVARTNALKPDLVVITGDLVDGSVRQIGRFVAPIQNFRSKYGTYFITGNHDYYSGASEWCSAIQGLGIHVLRNRFMSVGDIGGSLDLVGVDDWGARRMDEGGYDLDVALQGRDPSRAAVLLAHEPSNFEEAARRGMGLQLSGHTHGGQLFPATAIGRLIWGQRNAGLSAFEGAQIYVSRGCGFVGPPMRVGSPPELVKITLLPG